MYKFLVLTAVLAVAASAPAPGYLGGYAYAPVAYPLATSYQNRVDVHSNPIVITKPVLGYAADYGYAGYPSYSDLGYEQSYGYGTGGIHGYGGAFSYNTHSVHPY